jgi:hypothetical protein
MVAPAGSPVTLKVTVPVFPVRTRVTAALALEPSGTVSVEVESWSVMPFADWPTRQELNTRSKEKRSRS